MRGILKFFHHRVLQVGITPAHAGNTSLCIFHCVGFWDHPRACGEYPLRLVILPHFRGSPPRMRGIPVWRFVRMFAKGITPAHAGNTDG